MQHKSISTTPTNRPQILADKSMMPHGGSPPHAPGKETWKDVIRHATAPPQTICLTYTKPQGGEQTHSSYTRSHARGQMVLAKGPSPANAITEGEEFPTHAFP